MSKFTEFYKKAVADETAKKEMTAILGDKGLNEATDEELEKVSEVAKKLGVDITAEEIKEFASGNAELDEDDLEAAAGGGGYYYKKPNPDYLKDRDSGSSEGPRWAPIGTPLTTWWL